MAFLFYFQGVNTSSFICFNGEALPADQPILRPDNRGYRYGDGIFETMKMVSQKIPLLSYHLDRLFNGLELLKYDVPSSFTSQKLAEETRLLCEKNKAEALCRVRLSVYRDNESGPNYIIECFPETSSVNELNENGFIIDIYPDARKICDAFSHLKSANYLPYLMAALYAKEHEYNDCLVMNQHDRIADASIANVFLIKNNTIITPPLSEGCVGGVMRKYLLEKIGPPYQVKEEPITQEMILDADELFLTNAVKGIRWVKQFRNKGYHNTQTMEIYNRFVKTIWE